MLISASADLKARCATCLNPCSGNDFLCPGLPCSLATNKAQTVPLHRGLLSRCGKALMGGLSPASSVSEGRQRASPNGQLGGRLPTSCHYSAALLDLPAITSHSYVSIPKMGQRRGARHCGTGSGLPIGTQFLAHVLNDNASSPPPRIFRRTPTGIASIQR